MALSIGEGEMEQSVFTRKYICVTELVQKIYDHSNPEFKGTTHEDNWYFYHDALSQMIVASTVQ